MVDGVVHRAHAPPDDAPHDLLLRHVEAQDDVERVVHRGEVAVQRLGLGHGAGEAVEQESVAGVGLLEPVGDHADHDVVGDEVTAVHVELGLLPQRRAGRDVQAEDVAGGHTRHAVGARDVHGLGALAGTRWAEQHESHDQPPRL